MLEDKEAAQAILKWIYRTYDNEETNRDYRVATRVYGCRVTDDGVQDDSDKPPKGIDWIPSWNSSTYDPAPDPAMMLHWETDVVPMIDANLNSSDAAAIALQFDAGLRGGEFRDLTDGPPTDHKYGLQVTIQGKWGKRTVTLIPWVPYVQQWLNDHPGNGNPKAPMWSKLSTPVEVLDRMIAKLFEEAAARAWDVDLDTHGFTRSRSRSR